MKKDTLYYLEALNYDGGGGDHLSLAVSMENVKYPNAKAGGAVNEVQRISLKSTYTREQQVNIGKHCKDYICHGGRLTLNDS